jgi:hypothetical protein
MFIHTSDPWCAQLILVAVCTGCDEVGDLACGRKLGADRHHDARAWSNRIAAEHLGTLLGKAMGRHLFPASRGKAALRAASDAVERLRDGSNALQNVRFAAPERGKAALGERELKLAQITGAQGEIVRQVGGRGLERAPRDRVPPVRQADCTIAPDLATNSAS